ncbi:hypothetical protein EHM69_04255 [candidate division KSB1 bacterium]|nr:MAG: hypothetical protein EHM69_04255 [candidate division KSB1 bacterium]
MVVGFSRFLLRDGLVEDDFEATYVVDALQSGDTQLDNRTISFRAPDSELRTSYKDREYTAVVQNADESKWCVQCTRSLLYSRRLVSHAGTCGRVAYRNLMLVNPEFRKRGIASTIIEREEQQIFRKWDAAEIQAVAALDGPKVWPKTHYGYEAFPDHLLLLKLAYEIDWAQGNVDSTQINSIRDFPDDFWEYFCQQNRQFEIYKVLT